MSSVASLYNEMNIFLSDQIVLGMKIHNIHWYLKGSSFYTLHPKMDELYAEAEERVDEVAERLLAIGGAPLGSLKSVLAMTTITELEDKDIVGNKALEILIVDFVQVQKHVRNLISLANDLDDYGTGDYFTRVLQDYDKAIWMMKSYIH